MDNIIFKVWTCDRKNKTMVLIKEKEDILKTLISIASPKLGINGDKLVLESDGTPVEDNEILLLLNKETLILLQKEEIWANERKSFSHSSSNVSSCSNASSLDMCLPNFGDETLNENLENIDILNSPLLVDANMDYMWSNFKIPWDKLPVDVLQHCEQGKRNKQYISQIIHTIVHEMRQIRPKIPMKAFKYAAKQLVEKYPDTFKDVDNDGVAIGDGMYSAISKLSDRNHYLNRPHKRAHPGSSSFVKAGLRKKQANLEAGCLNWAPPPPVGEVNLSKKEKLNSMNVEDDEFFTLLEETYPETRQFFNNIESPPTITEVKNNWPVLFRKSVIFWHFKKLTGVDLTIVQERIKLCAEKIVAYGIAKKVIGEAVPDKQIQQVLEFYAKNFREDINLIIYRIEDSDASPMTLLKIPEPCIIEYGNENRYDIFMEKQYVLSSSAFLEAFSIMFALYFIFNLEYPKRIGGTLEMFQRMHCKIHPSSGSKSTSTKKKFLH